MHYAQVKIFLLHAAALPLTRRRRGGRDEGGSNWC
jgi:hypothetical protein